MIAQRSAPLSTDETEFFGRQREIEEIERRFAAGARLVTLVGLGGIGKTRLAMALVMRAPEKRSVLRVTLGETKSLEAAVREVARAARVKVKAESQARGALETVAKALAERGRVLVLLDNLEQLAGAAEELVGGLLGTAGATELAILATSREPVGVRGEQKIVLAPLDEAEAIALLSDRARLAAGMDVAMTEEQARTIVQRVDRLPLAIELAASRLEVLSAAELIERLTKLDVLTDASAPSAGTHHLRATMRATLEGSWELLSDGERSVLAQVSVFAAPFGIDAAEDIVVPSESSGEVLDVLESLVKRSLLFRHAGADGRARLAMFDTVRVWARDKLAGGSAAGGPSARRAENGGITVPTAQDVKGRHARFHLEEASRAASRAYGDQAVAALDRLQELLPELLVAFDWAREAEPAVAARIVLALSDLLLFRGLLELRTELFDAGAVAAERAGDERLLARSLVAKARVTLEVGRIQDAEVELRRALVLAASSQDDITWAEATRSLGWALTALGRTADAEIALLAAQTKHREHGSARGLADAHVALGILFALQGRPTDALANLREALAIHVEHGDVIRQEKVLGFGALVGQDARELARGLPREVLARAPRSSIDVLPSHVAELVQGERESGLRWQEAIELYRQGALAHERGDPASAVERFDHALARLAKTGMKRGVAAVHGHAAAVFASMGDRAEADARLDRAREASKAEPAAQFVVEMFAAAVEASFGERAAARDLFERATRAEIGTPELAMATRVLERALDERRHERHDAVPSRSGAALVVGVESRWIAPPNGERIDLLRYGPIRRLLEALVVARLEHPGVALSAEDLIRAGWPGEKMKHTAGLLRVYSAIRRLRRLGLEPLLVTRDDGYLVDPNAAVQRDAG